MGNLRRDQFISDIQTLEELFCGKGIQLNDFVESLDLVALVLNEIGWHFAD